MWETKPEMYLRGNKSHWELRGPGIVSWILARPIRPIPNAMFQRLWAQSVPLRTLIILRRQRISVNYQNLHRQLRYRTFRLKSLKVQCKVVKFLKQAVRRRTVSIRRLMKILCFLEKAINL